MAKDWSEELFTGSSAALVCEFATRAGNDYFEGLVETPHSHPVETLLAGLEDVTQARLLKERRGW